MRYLIIFTIKSSVTPFWSRRNHRFFEKLLFGHESSFLVTKKLINLLFGHKKKKKLLFGHEGLLFGHQAQKKKKKLPFGNERLLFGHERLLFGHEEKIKKLRKLISIIYF
jgi:hypothetical protein